MKYSQQPIEDQLRVELQFAEVQYAALLTSGPAHKTRNKVQRLAELRARMDRLEAQLTALTPAPANPPRTNSEELRQDQELLAELTDTISRLLDGCRRSAALSWWREQRWIIRQQHHWMRELRKKGLGW